MTFVSYPHNGEGVVLNRLFGDLDHGFYVDVGAMDPVQDSVTKAFYDRGWSGINVEPNPDGAAKLAEGRSRDRNLTCVLGSTPGSTTFYAVQGAGAGISTTSRELAHAVLARGFEVIEHQRQVRLLREVLAEAGATTIHFLKIHVEGAERDVLLGMDFDQWRPWVVLVEALTTHESVADRRGLHDAWASLVVDHGYRFALDDGVNRRYVANEQAPALLERCSFPACVLDDWIPARTAVLLHHLETTTSALTRTTAALEAVQQQYARLMQRLQGTEVAPGSAFAPHRGLDLAPLVIPSGASRTRRVYRGTGGPPCTSTARPPQARLGAATAEAPRRRATATRASASR